MSGTQLDGVKLYRLVVYMDTVKIGCYIAFMPAANTKKTSPRSRSYHHGDLRPALVEEAARLLGEEGEDALSMRRLAQNLGVSRMAPYHHFPDKHGLMCAVAEEGFRRLLEMIDGDDFLNGRSNTRSGLRAFIDNYIRFSLHNRHYYELMFGARLWKVQQPTEQLREYAHGAFKSYVEKMRRLPLVSAAPGDALRYAQVSWSTLHGISRVVIDGIYLQSDAVSAMCDAAADMMWRAFQPD